MREGPLAALFRSTEQQEAEAGKEEIQQGPASAAAPAPAQPEAPEGPPIPSPQERLRHAFSADIPENVMSPSTPAARERPRPESQAAPAETPEGAGAPVLRVVGVGGAGPPSGSGRPSLGSSSRRGGSSWRGGSCWRGCSFGRASSSSVLRKSCARGPSRMLALLPLAIRQDLLR